MSVANSFNNQNALSIFPATSGFLQVVTTPSANISSVTPGTVPHFDCSNEVERDITDILIYHDILISVSKPGLEKATVKAGGQNFIFVNLNIPKETTWIIGIGDKKPNVYKIRLSGKTLRFFKPDGTNYKITHDNIVKVLLTLIHNEMDFCNKCTVPKQEFLVFQESESADTVYDWGYNWMPKQQQIKTAPNTSGITISTTSGSCHTSDLTTVTTVADEDPYTYHQLKSIK